MKTRGTARDAVARGRGASPWRVAVAVGMASMAIMDAGTELVVDATLDSARQGPSWCHDPPGR